jgi:hypothetical protein
MPSTNVVIALAFLKHNTVYSVQQVAQEDFDLAVHVTEQK